MLSLDQAKIEKDKHKLDIHPDIAIGGIEPGDAIKKTTMQEAKDTQFDNLSGYGLYGYSVSTLRANVYQPTADDRKIIEREHPSTEVEIKTLLINSSYQEKDKNVELIFVTLDAADKENEEVLDKKKLFCGQSFCTVKVPIVSGGIRSIKFERITVKYKENAGTVVYVNSHGKKYNNFCRPGETLSIAFSEYHNEEKYILCDNSQTANKKSSFTQYIIMNYKEIKITLALENQLREIYEGYCVLINNENSGLEYEIKIEDKPVKEKKSAGEKTHEEKTEPMTNDDAKGLECATVNRE